jgi:lysophospholipase L1-like esterase
VAVLLTATIAVVCLAMLARILATPTDTAAPAVAAGPPVTEAKAANDCLTGHWVASWEAAPSDGTSDVNFVDDEGYGVSDQTVRIVITPHFGGTQIRLHFSNRFGSQPLVLGEVAVARQAATAAIATGTSAWVTFAGKRSVTIPAGDDVVSDPVRFSFAAFDDLAVSMYIPGFDVTATRHAIGEQTSYLTAPLSGDHVADVSGRAFTSSTTSRLFVDGLDVFAPGTVSAVVALGDSITDGLQSTTDDYPGELSAVDQNGRWPDDAQRRIDLEDDPNISIVDAGISGNRILRNGDIARHGLSALNRLQSDVLDESGVKTVIVLEGINDLAQVPHATAPQIIAGLTELVARIHRAHLRVLLGTLTPVGGSIYATPALIAARTQINTWIRGQQLADGVVDFDAAVRDPADPQQIAPAYDDGDHVHFSLAGYAAMADAISLAALAGNECQVTGAAPATRA